METTWENEDTAAQAVGAAEATGYRLYQVVQAEAAARAEAAAMDALACAAQAGDLAARDTLYAQLEPALLEWARPARRWARAAGGGRLDEADVCQEVFVCFADLLRDWQPGRAPFAAYLRTLLPRRLLAYVRRTLRPRELALTGPALAGDSSDDAEAAPSAAPALLAPDPAALYAADATVAALLAALDPRRRQIVVLYILVGVPMPVIAYRLGISLRLAWYLYRAALATLRRASAEC